MEKDRTIEENSILMTCIAGSQKVIGNVALVNRKIAFNQQINGIVPKKCVNLYFLYIQFIIAKKYIQDNSTNSMKGMVSKGVLSNLEFIVPPIEEQQHFEKIFLKYIEQKELMQQSLSEMENNFNSLMQRAFKGELFN